MPDETRVVLLATASAGTPVLLAAQELALSLGPARERTVAVISLTAFGAQEIRPALSSGDLLLDEPWKLALLGGSGVVLIDRAGPQPDGRPAEWLSAGAFLALLEKLTGRFELILVEAGSDPPPAPQQLALAPLCSGAVLLVRPGISTAAEVRRCETLLSQQGARFLGWAFVEGG